jgi:hypothetical protein
MKFLKNSIRTLPVLVFCTILQKNNTLAQSKNPQVEDEEPWYFASYLKQKERSQFLDQVYRSTMSQPRSIQILYLVGYGVGLGQKKDEGTLPTHVQGELYLSHWFSQLMQTNVPNLTLGWQGAFQNPNQKPMPHASSHGPKIQWGGRKPMDNAFWTSCARHREWTSEKNKETSGITQFQMCNLSLRFFLFPGLYGQASHGRNALYPKANQARIESSWGFGFRWRALYLEVNRFYIKNTVSNFSFMGNFPIKVTLGVSSF